MAKPTLLQALGDKRMAAILFLSFASGLPFNLTNFTLQAWLASARLDIKTIGIFSLVALPYIFKFLWAPLLDRYLPPILGRRRGWIVIYQACLAVGIGVMGFCSPARRRPMCWAASRCSWRSFPPRRTSSSMPIGSMRFRRANAPWPPRRPPSATARRRCWPGPCWCGLPPVIGWRLAFLFVACLMAATMLATLWAPEPAVPGPRAAHIGRRGVAAAARLCCNRKACGAFCCLVLLYKFGDAFALACTAPS